MPPSSMESRRKVSRPVRPQGPQRRHGTRRLSGDPAIGGIDAACTRSRRLCPWRCACCSQALGGRQHLRKAHRQLPCRRLLRPRLSLAWPPPLAPLPSLPSASAPPSPAPRSPSHPARCARQDGGRAIIVPFAPSANSEKARRRPIARKPAGTARAAQPASLPSRRSRPRVVECRTLAKGARQRRGPPPAAPPGGASAPVPEPDELSARRAELALQPREQLLLKRVPVIR